LSIFNKNRFNFWGSIFWNIWYSQTWDSKTSIAIHQPWNAESNLKLKGQSFMIYWYFLCKIMSFSFDVVDLIIKYISILYQSNTYQSWFLWQMAPKGHQWSIWFKLPSLLVSTFYLWYALEILICGCSLFYRREYWASKSAGANSTYSLKIRGCKRWCSKDLQVCAPTATLLTHFLMKVNQCMQNSLSIPWNYIEHFLKFIVPSI
jgi:hypothetical protein